MKPNVLLWIATAIAVLFAVGHLLGGLQQWNPMGANAVLALMASEHFPVEGHSRSYLDLYLGLGWSGEVFLLLQAGILGQMALLARSDAKRLRPMIAAFAAAAAANGVIAWRFILLLPALLGLALFVVLLLALAETFRGAEESSSEAVARRS